MMLGALVAAFLQGAEPTVVEALRAGQRLMFVGAHPDDETTAGPLLARAAESSKCMVVILTRGEGGENRIGTEQDAALGEIRVKELSAACAVLGAEHRNLGFWNGLPRDAQNPDGGRESPRDAIARWKKSGRDPKAELLKVMREWKPDIVVSFDGQQGFTGHREHRAAGILAAEAFAELGRGSGWKPRSFYCTMNPYAQEIHPRLPGLDEKKVVERIDGTARSARGRSYVDIAMEAWARHESQVGRDVLKTDFAKRMARVIGTTVLARP